MTGFFVGAAVGITLCFVVILAKATSEAHALAWDGFDELEDR